jgi:quercetin dioxygenase-like cupin family protein
MQVSQAIREPQPAQRCHSVFFPTAIKPGSTRAGHVCSGENGLDSQVNLAFIISLSSIHKNYNIIYLLHGRGGAMARKQEETFGRKIRNLREEKGVSLDALSRETGYPAEVLKDVEEGKIAPPVALVLQLGRTFKMDIEQIQGGEDKQASKRRAKSHKKRVASYAYAPLTRPGEEKHLRAYRVTINAQTQHKGVEYHHEGEEFVYVLSGGLKIQVGQNVSMLEEGESITFDSSLHHALSNPTDEKAELLVVIYVP